MRQRVRWARGVGALASVALVLTGCTTVVTGSYVEPPVAPAANLSVVGDSGGAFDQTVKNALSDVFTFWKAQYPKVSGGEQLPKLSGKLYSVDGEDPSAEASQNACLSKAGTDVVIDNAFYCQLDDSIAWDRNVDHLVPALGAKYGPLLVAMVFAHEFGHAVQARLGLFDQQVSTIVHETQADCAAGAFTAYALSNQAPHVRATSADVDRALVGYLNVRDDTPTSQMEVSHGDGFDRISAVADGLDKGVIDCFASDWSERKFTERPFVPGSSDEQQQGNEPFEQVIDPRPTDPNGGGGGGLQPDLNRFWKQAAQSINKPWTDVKIAQADHVPCGNPSSEFGYCPADNTVYFNVDFAKQAYNSMTALDIDRQTSDVSVVENQPGDFALGTLFAYGWGMAVRHQLFGRSLDDTEALLAASCYTGAYAKDINVEPTEAGKFTLSPPDMDEATSAVLSLVGQDKAFGARGTTGLNRVQAFTKGYNGGLSVC